MKSTKLGNVARIFNGNSINEKVKAKKGMTKDMPKKSKCKK